MPSLKGVGESFVTALLGLFGLMAVVLAILIVIAIIGTLGAVIGYGLVVVFNMVAGTAFDPMIGALAGLILAILGGSSNRSD